MKKIHAKFDCDAPEYAGNNNLKIYFYKCYFPEIRGFFIKQEMNVKIERV